MLFRGVHIEAIRDCFDGSGPFSSIQRADALERHMERGLAAIVLGDIVGYSHLMGDDETGTLIAAAALRSTIIAPAVEARGGRLVKATGDGFLSEFSSVVGAVASEHNVLSSHWFNCSAGEMSLWLAGTFESLRPLAA